VIYGLKQSLHTWYTKNLKFLTDPGFQDSEHHYNMYIHSIFKLILLVYADDLVITSPNLHHISWIQYLLVTEFEITDLKAAHHIYL